jgi:glycosyltransferase involved in cell wall biosynthesis
MHRPFISVVIPVHNGAATIGPCLAAAGAVDYEPYEVIVVDDGSTDGTAAILQQHPKIRVVSFAQNGGASKARNAGVAAAKGEFVFFTDDDCVMQRDTLQLAAKAIAEEGGDCVIGGTYKQLAHDHGLFSSFQSVFVNYSETKYRNPDYIATHAMLIPTAIFRGSDKFNERFMPILEDVDYCHRLRRAGVRLVMRPEIVVGHIFLFDLWRSLRNAFKKSRYWVAYSIRNKDLLTDSGTASIELKSNVALWFVELAALALYAVSGNTPWLWAFAAALTLNLVLSRRLLFAYFAAGGGPAFAVGSLLYYLVVYPLAVALGSLRGAMDRP